MAWTYSDWVTYPDSSPAAKLTQLRKHIQEVSDQITADVTKGGSGRQTGRLQDYLERLYTKETDLMAMVAAACGRRAYTANMNGSRP